MLYIYIYIYCVCVMRSNIIKIRQTDGKSACIHAQQQFNIHLSDNSIYVYIYIYMYVCVCEHVILHVSRHLNK